MEFKKPGDKYFQKKKSEAIESAAEEADRLKEPAKKPKNLRKSLKLFSFKSPFQGVRRTRLIVAIAIVATAAISCGVFFVVSANSTNQSQLTADLDRLGRDFYESYYYKQIETAYDTDKLKEFLGKYETTGIKINLDNLGRYTSESLDPKAIAAEFKNSKTDAPCDTTETKVTIYPTSPYGQADYRIETSLACGFES